MSVHAGAPALLDVDPELGSRLSADRLAAARSQLGVRVVPLPRGDLAVDELASVGADGVGLLLLDGVVTRAVALDDIVSTELLGPGDLIRPWAVEEELRFVAQRVHWRVHSHAQVAVLGRFFGAAVVRFPELNAALIDRAAAQTRRLATIKAISHLNSVERRLLALFWHLAERWGRVTGEGIVVPLTLPHRLLGELVGARRPTVSSALAVLRSEGRLLRRGQDAWLLRDEPVSWADARGGRGGRSAARSLAA
jgi:CRP/FNR family transcriptional regulator, cyclic AMP receptor protein